MKRFGLIWCLLFGYGAMSLQALDYLVNPNEITDSEYIVYKEKIFWIEQEDVEYVDVNLVKPTIAEVLAIAKDGDNIYFYPGTYSESFTISIPNMGLIGGNAYCDNRSGKRNVSQESVFTGVISVEADNVSINGFKFTEGGQVKNTKAVKDSPLSGFEFKYNLVEGSTLGASTPVIYFGEVYTGANAQTDVSQLRYNGFHITHNDFDGTTSTAHNPFVKLGGGYGNILVHDNTFTAGGCSVEIGNSRGNITITNNKFKNVGQALYDATAAAKQRGGAFCIYLNRNSYAGSTNVNISHNDFENCTGRQTVYCLIRYFQGDSADDYVVPVGTSAKVNYNVFRNKTTYSHTGDYNYVLYCNKDYMGDVEVDARYNYFDNSDMCIGMIKMPQKTEQERFFANSFGFYDFRKSQGVTYERVLNSWENYRSTRVAQSFDVSEYDRGADGNPYYFFNHIQPEGEAGNFSKYGCYEAQLITRVNDANTTNEKRAHLDAIHVGHGSNMAVFRHNNKNWVAIGGYGVANSANDGCTSNGISIFPYNSANIDANTDAVVNCNGSKTTYIDNNGNTRPLYTFKTDNELANSSWYNHFPAIDETSRYLAVLSRKGGTPKKMCVEIYDLDAILNHLINNATRPTLIKTFQIEQYADKELDKNVTGDKGFWGWDHQGFTIMGDYIYFMEGVGAANSTAINSKPTVIFHAYNWRTGKSHLRRTVEADVIMAMSHGEPEGIKIKRDAAGDGRSYLYLNIANGPSGNRNVNLIKYTNSSTGNGIALPLDKGATTSNSSAMNFNISYGTSDTQTLTLNNTYLKGDLTATISGEHAQYFNITTDATNALSDISTITVTYDTELPATANHNAVLRLSSPYAEDVLVPLSGTYNGLLSTGIESNLFNDDCIYLSGNNIIVPKNVLSISVYDMSGRILIHDSENVDTSRLSSGIYIVKCLTADGEFVKKIKL